VLKVFKVFIVTKVCKAFNVLKVFKVFIVTKVCKVFKEIKVIKVIKLDLMIGGKGRGMSCQLASILAASGTCKKVKRSKETEWLLRSQPQFHPTYLWIPSQLVHCI